MGKTISVSIFICTMITSGYLATSAIANQPQNLQLASNNFILRNSNGVILNDSANNSSNDKLTKTLTIGGLAATIGSLCWYISRYRQPNVSNFISRSDSNTMLLDRVNPKLRRKLLRLVNDPKTANRLLTGIHKHHSDRSPNWLAEKAIYDLRRGR